MRKHSFTIGFKNRMRGSGVDSFGSGKEQYWGSSLHGSKISVPIK